MEKIAKKEVQTITINNFTGRLTRYLNGDLNSGYAKFATSFGYDPFSKPGNLLWNLQPTDIKSTGRSSITSVGLAGFKTSDPFYTMVDAGGKVYIISTNLSTINVGVNVTTNALYDNPSLIANYSTLTGPFNYGAGIVPVTTGEFLLSSDTRVLDIQADLSGSSVLAIFTSSVTANIPHPLIEFLGKNYYGNGNNIGEIDGVIINGARLSPPLPSGMRVTDLDVTPEGDYLIITASDSASPQSRDYIAQLTTGPINYAANSYIFYWNGVDDGVTTYKKLPSFPAQALETFLGSQFTFIQDAFGAALLEGNKKLLTMPNNLQPMPNALSANGTFLTWSCVEGTGSVTSSTVRYDDTFTSLYYLGKLDEENPTGLWRMLRIAPTSDQAYISPMNQVINNFSQMGDLVVGWGKHYVSTEERNSPYPDTITQHFYRWVLNPGGNTAPVLGVYETQTQLFSKRMHVVQVRVYTEDTVANNGFQLDLIGADGTSFYTNSYAFVAGSDVQKLQGSLERINFNPNADAGYALGVRLTNTGTTNMTIKKVEIDWSPEGK